MCQRSLGAVFWLLASASLLHAQRATEMYIPIGESPELSDERTVIGTIEDVDAEERTIVVARESSGERHTAEITEETHIYLDRSKLGEKNDYGTFDDLTEGTRVEILYLGEERVAEGPARWIKIEVTR